MWGPTKVREAIGVRSGCRAAASPPNSAPTNVTTRYTCCGMAPTRLDTWQILIGSELSRRVDLAIKSYPKQIQKCIFIPTCSSSPMHALVSYPPGPTTDSLYLGEWGVYISVSIWRLRFKVWVNWDSWDCLLDSVHVGKVGPMCLMDYYWLDSYKRQFLGPFRYNPSNLTYFYISPSNILNCYLAHQILLVTLN